MSSSTAVPSRVRRLWLGVGVALIVFLAPALVAGYYFLLTEPERALKAALEETDQLDPDWRIEGLEKRRAAAPKENAATRVLEIAALLPKNWDVQPPFDKLPPLRLLHPAMQLPPREARALALGLDPLARAADKARGLAFLPDGRFELTFADDFISTQPEYLEKVLTVANLLELDVARKAQENQAAPAWISSLAILNAGRALGDEPLGVSQFYRAMTRERAVRAFERTLGQGEVDAKLLPNARSLIEQDLKHPLTRILLEGQRYHTHRTLRLLPTSPSLRQSVKASGGLTELEAEDLDKGLVCAGAEAYLLRWFNEAIAATKRSDAEEAKFWTEQAVAVRPSRLAEVLTKAQLKMAEEATRSTALLRCALAGIGVEHYRMLRKEWPASLEAVAAAGFLKEVPRDPFDGEPMRYRRTKEGVVIYSVGPTARYGGDALDNPPFRLQDVATRLEFRLYEIARRRQRPA